jgi:hypothetical protein
MLLLISLKDNNLILAHPPVFAFFTCSPIYYGSWLEAKKLARTGSDALFSFRRFPPPPSLAASQFQCCQLAEISAAKHKSGPKKISAARQISGQFSENLAKSGRKEAELFLTH